MDNYQVIAPIGLIRPLNFLSLRGSLYLIYKISLYMKKNLNNQRNQLKLLLILNDFYQILCYFRQPFFELGNKTAQQITNIPIFFSFFIMSLSILQISFNTRNFSILKNYPLLVNLADHKIPQKFETLYLQLLDNKEIQKIQLQERRKKAKTQLYQQLSEKEILFMDFYKYLKTNKPEFPTIFHQIQNTKQKQDTINLYKTFEQIGPILLSEIKKEKTAFPPGGQKRRQKEKALIHLEIDIPYQNWSSITKNFNILDDKNLTNWQFKDSNLIIKDLKKENHLDKAYNIVQQFIVQYNNYVKENENKKYICLKDKIFPFQKIQIIQNLEKLDFKTPTPSLPPQASRTLSPEQRGDDSRNWYPPLVPLSNKGARKSSGNHTLSIVTGWPAFITQSHLLSFLQSLKQKLCASQSAATGGLSPEQVKANHSKQKVEFVPTGRYPPKAGEPRARTGAISQQNSLNNHNWNPLGIAARWEDLTKNVQKSKTNDPKNQLHPTQTSHRERWQKGGDGNKGAIIRSYEKRLKKKIAQFQKKLLSGKELVRIRENTQQSQSKKSKKSFLKQKQIEDLQRILRFLNEARLIRGDLSQTPLRSQRKQHETHIAVFKSELPSLKHWSWSQTFYLNSINILNQIQKQKIEDQIPTKMQGFLDIAPLFYSGRGSVHKGSHFVQLGSTEWTNNQSDKWTLFGDTQYQKREYELLTDDKKVWAKLYKKLSKLNVNMPTLMELYDQYHKETKKRSLLNIKFISHKREPLKNFIQFLELTQKKIPIFRKFLRKFEKFQLKELKHIGQFDVEIQENENFTNPKVDYHFQLHPSPQFTTVPPDSFSRRFFLETIWSIPKPEFLYLNNFEIFLKSFPNEVGKPVGAAPLSYLTEYRALQYGDLKTHSNFMNWRQTKARKTFDNYLKKISYLLQLQKKNPYFYLDEIIFPEDYLLETLFFFIKQNLMTLEQKRASQSDESKENTSMHQTLLLSLGTKGKTSIPISKIFDYLNNRKKQRNLFLKNSEKVLQIKNLLEKKRKIQTSFLYDSILNNYFSDLQILKKILKNFKFSLQNKKSSGKKIKSGFLPPIVPSLGNAKKIQLNLQKPEQIINWIFQSNWLEVLDRFAHGIPPDKITGQRSFLESNFLRQKNRNQYRFITFDAIAPLFYPTVSRGLYPPATADKDQIANNKLLSNFYKFGSPQMAAYERFAMQLIWFTFKRAEFLAEFQKDTTKSNKKVALLASSLKEEQPQINPSLRDALINWIKLQTQNQTIPYDCVDKYYLLKKLPKIPKNIDHPAIVINKTNTVQKKSYPYRIINLPIITPFKQKKIKQAKEIISKLNVLNPRNAFQFNFYNQFDSIMQEYLEPSLQSTGTKIKTKSKTTGRRRPPRLALPKSRARDRVRAKNRQKIDFTKTIDEILDDLNHYPKDKSSEIRRNQKCLSQKQPIYQSALSRQMSGYLFPDLERKQLSNLVLKPFQRFQKNQTIVIPITNINININDFIQQLPELQIERFNHSIRTPFRIFKHQQKISQKGFWESQFFEFRENFNDYSWSLFFLLSSGWIFINIFQNLYKKYAKEFVESGIDFLKRAGILDDVQWIKEELGMTTIDKAYRGIRHHGKKFKNIIGLDRKHTISQVSEMIWFLKTKTSMCNSIDPFVQVLLLLSNYLAGTKTRLWAKKYPTFTISPSALSTPIPKHEPIHIKLRTLISKDELPYIDVLTQTLDDIIFLNSAENKETSSLTLRPFRLRASSLDFDKESKNSVRSLDFKKPVASMTWIRSKQHYLKPKGFLLTGPPGTGKTLLVQVIAGETGVPVVTQSGGLLQSSRLLLVGCGKGAKTLHKLFLRAREIAPCMIFIDEIDGIGTRRQFLPLYIDVYGRYDPIETLYRLESQEALTPPKTFQPKLKRRAEFLDDHDPYWEEPEFTQTVQSNQIPIDILQDIQFSRGARSEQLSILTQLLIELDGLHSLENILVIGATNRLEILDPALMRPGRFQRILKFNLPDYAARIHLFKLYTQASKIGIENISWDYFSKRTHGLSSADIASIVFASELTAIQQSRKHTFETLERGIDLITSFPSDPVVFRLKAIFIFFENKMQKFFEKNSFYSLTKLGISEAVPTPVLNENLIAVALRETSNIYRNCYYNLGKIVILFCLHIQDASSSAYISLWVRPKNFRFFFFTKNFNEFDEFDQKMFSRKDIEKRLLTFFGGKAAESLFIFLPLNQFSPEIYFQFDQTFISLNNSLEQSNFGIEDEIQTAQNLLKLMIEKWYFYLEKIATENFHPILENANLWEYPESEKEIFLGQALVDEMIIDLDMRNRLSKNEQKYSYQTWWMKKVATRLNFRENLVLQWSRIYLSDPENSAQNIEWSAPDEYFHTLLRTPPYCMAWTHFLENGRFAISNLLLLQSFNTVLRTLRQFSELMDFLSDYFLRYECLRENEFQRKISQFFSYLLQNNKIQ